MPTAALGSALPSRARGIPAKFAWRSPPKYAMRKDARCARSEKQRYRPTTTVGDHDHLGGLPDPIVEVVHRIVTDPARLTRRWFEAVTDAGLSDADYVEVVGVVAQVIALDTFAHALGIAARSLPDACAGEPSRQRPHGVKDNGSWVPTIVPGDHGPDEADLFDGIGRSNIWSALSAVPHEMRGFFDVMNTQIPARTGNAGFRHRVPRHHPSANRIVGEPGLGNQPVFLLNGHPRASAPCER